MLWLNKFIFFFGAAYFYVMIVRYLANRFIKGFTHKEVMKEIDKDGALFTRIDRRKD